ncbi:protein FAM217B [Trichomycterus rosablanca]|uniref:protein FAM217B n=1 Tax=Trichomycterus rosablanca TaxID=2290929 RepID=UPI002F3514FC
MGTMLQERTMHSDYKNLNNRVKNKPSRHAPRNPREVITKPNYQVTSTNGLKNRSHRQNTRRNSEKSRNGNQDQGKLPRSLPSSLTSVPAQSPELPKQKTHTEQVKPNPKDEDADSGSDLSELERIPRPPSSTEPPQLYLREEVIHPQDLQSSRHLYRSRTVFSDSYPDFLPPPFNSWSLRQLAVYLNTDGKGIPRLRPVSQLERYLERVLQLEWFQIQTVHEESNKSTWTRRQGPRTSPHSSLSAPKSILHCQRAFPWALLSSLQPQGCNGACRLYTNSHHTHLSPLTEKSTKTQKLPRRSSSESRVHQFRSHRSHRLSDSLDGSNYIKHMQAIGNIRNPSGFTCNFQDVSGNVTTESLRRKGSGGRSRSCGDVSKDEYRRARAHGSFHESYYKLSRKNRLFRFSNGSSTVAIMGS